MLEVTNLSVNYGEVRALHEVNLQVGRGEMVALIGPNGAGKSTLVNTLSGILTPAGGSVQLQGRLTQVPEGRQLFASLTVEDNLRVGAWESRERDPRRVYDVLPELERIKSQIAGTLSGGQQQMVAVGRALMANPDILAVDELSLGLAPKIVTQLGHYLRRLNSEQGIAVLLIEQNARMAFELCERAYVLESGAVVGAGTCEALSQSEHVVQAYLGMGAATNRPSTKAKS